MLLAFLVSDGEGDDFNDQQEHVLIYHVTEEAAREMGRAYLSSSPNYRDTVAKRAPQYDSRCVAMTEPDNEEDPEYLRTMGWGYEGERSCDSCGLRAYGIKEYGVCKESGQCKQCGCVGAGESGSCEHVEGFSCG